MIKTQKIVLDLDRFRPRKRRKTKLVSPGSKPEKTEMAVLSKPEPSSAKKPTVYTMASKWQVRPSKELAYCRDCGTERSMLWKPPEMRGKHVDSWFVCAGCGAGNLTIKMLPYNEATRQNREQNDNKEVPF